MTKRQFRWAIVAYLAIVVIGIGAGIALVRITDNLHSGTQR